MDIGGFLTIITMVCALNIFYVSLPGKRFRDRIRLAASHAFDRITKSCEKNTATAQALTNILKLENDSCKSYKSLKNWLSINLDKDVDNSIQENFQSDKVKSGWRKIWTSVLRNNYDNKLCLFMSSIGCCYLFFSTYKSTFVTLSAPYEVDSVAYYVSMIFTILGMLTPLLCTLFSYIYLSSTIKSIKIKENEINDALRIQREDIKKEADNRKDLGKIANSSQIKRRNLSL